jgi:CheY-like chemotaxis protein
MTSVSVIRSGVRLRHGTSIPVVCLAQCGTERSKKVNSTGAAQGNRGTPSIVLLCIDDWPQMLNLRKATLELRGYSVEIASSGDLALKILEKRPVAAVLLEYGREGMDAEAIALHIRQRFPVLPIILLSAYSEIPERIIWLIDEYVMKSAPLEELLNAIERVTPPACNREDQWPAA